MHRGFRSFVSRSLFVGGLLLVSAAHAHDTVPLNACPVGGSETVVSQFTLTPLQLQQYRNAHVAAGECPDKSCGIVDDWYWASAMAMEQCAQNKSLLAQDTPAPKILAPSYFYGTGHHQLYQLKTGVSGVCVVRTCGATY